MKVYNYKIQWLLPIFTTSQIDDALKMVEILGHRAIQINFMDKDLNIIGNFPTISYGTSQEETVRRELEYAILDNYDIMYIEILRK